METAIDHIADYTVYKLFETMIKTLSSVQHPGELSMTYNEDLSQLRSKYLTLDEINLLRLLQET